MSKWSDFRALHQRPRPFIIPNPWDPGTARLLEVLGFEALATTSAGFAFSRGKRDNAIGRDAMIEHVREVAAATALPVSADLENGYGKTLEEVAETYRLVAQAGAAGASIEDMGTDPAKPIYDLPLAVDRVHAAVEMVRALGREFTLTARCENYLCGRPDLKDTIARLQAYQEAGADVLYAPGLESKSDIETLVKSVDRPVNVLMVHSVRELGDLGVKRVSVGSALSRAALGAFLRAARELKERGTFTFAKDAAPYREIMEMMG